MDEIKKQKYELQDIIVKEGNELRKSLLDKLFNLNTLLSATYLVLFQLNIKSFEIKIFNILPFLSVIIILLYQLYDLRILGVAYYKLEDWKKSDYTSLNKMKETNNKVIFVSIILTLIEIGYLFYIFLK